MSSHRSMVCHGPACVESFGVCLVLVRVWRLGLLDGFCSCRSLAGICILGVLAPCGGARSWRIGQIATLGWSLLTGFIVPHLPMRRLPYTDQQ